MVLSHYTSEQGLIGIARSQSLWATEFLSLNDDSEFVFAARAIYEEALKEVIPRIPEELRDPSKGELSAGVLVAKYADALKTQMAAGNGFFSLYICSFARGRSEDEEKRGILTLWMRYTQGQGYCLQFEEDHVRELLDAEKRWSSYGWIELAEVRYGIDRASGDFLHLVRQTAQRLLRQLFQAYRDQRLEPDYKKIEVDSIFERKLLRFCASHKDPAFLDEREMRIFAYPADMAEARPFTGVAGLKTIYRRGNRPTGARYIVLGEGILPGLVPSRFIIGPKAELDVWKLNALYPLMPSFNKSDIPIR